MKMSRKQTKQHNVQSTRFLQNNIKSKNNSANAGIPSVCVSNRFIVTQYVKCIILMKMLETK